MTRMNKKRLQKWKDYELIATSLQYLHARHQEEADDIRKSYNDENDFVALFNEVEIQFGRLIHKYQTKADRLHKKIRRKVK